MLAHIFLVSWSASRSPWNQKYTSGIIKYKEIQHAMMLKRLKNVPPSSNSIKKLSCRRETARRFVSLNILLSHSRSLKVIGNDTVAYRACKSLLVFQWHYVCMSYRFRDIQHQIMAWPWNWGWSRSRSLKMAPFDRPYTTFYWSAIVSIAVFCTIFKFFNA